MEELTQKQINRQDFVDGQVFELIKKLLPENVPFDWDIDVIGEVRDMIRYKIVEEKGLMTEQDFYPYLEI